MQSSANARTRISWIEVAIVTVVLAVLAALVVPQFSQAGVDPREKEVRAAVQIVQGQIELYKAQHENHYPSLARFCEQMTLSSNNRGITGTTDANGFDCGPYLRRIPANPYSGTSDVGDRAGGPNAWLYDETTGRFQPNHAATN